MLDLAYETNVAVYVVLTENNNTDKLNFNSELTEQWYNTRFSTY